MAQGHGLQGEPQSKLSLQVFAGAGALKSTANDLLNYAAAQLGLRSTKLSALMKRSHVQLHAGTTRFGDTCMPWVNGGVYQTEGSRLIGHAGGTAGFSSFIGLDLKRRRGVVVLSASRQVFASPIGWTLLQGFPLSDNNLRFMVREIAAVGVALAKEDDSDELKITHVFTRLPAAKAGLERGQLILRVEGESVKERSLADCLKLMRKKPGVQIRLKIKLPNQGGERSVQVARETFLTAD